MPILYIRFCVTEVNLNSVSSFCSSNAWFLARFVEPPVTSEYFVKICFNICMLIETSLLTNLDILLICSICLIYSTLS